MTKQSFAAGMGKLALLSLAGGQEVDKAMTGLWWEAVQHLTDEQWEKAIRVTIQNTTTSYGKFPMPGLVLQHVTSDADRAAEAGQAFDLVSRGTVHRLKCHRVTVCDCIGDEWDYELLEARYGKAAAEAFWAAGGPGAFRSWDEGDTPFLLRRFVDAYVSFVRESPDAGIPQLPAPKPQHILPTTPEPTPGEARLAIAEIRRLDDIAARNGGAGKIPLDTPLPLAYIVSIRSATGPTEGSQMTMSRTQFLAALRIGDWRDLDTGTTYRAAYVGESALTGPDHAEMSDSDLIAEALREAVRGEIIPPNRAAAALGRKGGEAGTGDSKRRGDAATYAALGVKS